MIDVFNFARNSVSCSLTGSLCNVPAGYSQEFVPVEIISRQLADTSVIAASDARSSECMAQAIEGTGHPQEWAAALSAARGARCERELLYGLPSTIETAFRE